ncbi:mucin-2-like [Entelurus aequoreus]|uniref:mucin-2-like n=1 Tax=Entelurus aequoreus TaxID=161455 RepID=UPI002B1CFA8E|nr:mucin-2-like [Entelurus aequoreus]
MLTHKVATPTTGRLAAPRNTLQHQATTVDAGTRPSRPQPRRPPGRDGRRDPGAPDTQSGCSSLRRRPPPDRQAQNVPPEIYIHIYIHTHKHTHVHIHTHTHAYTYTYIYTYIHTYIHTHTHTYTYIYTVCQPRQPPRARAATSHNISHPPAPDPAATGAHTTNKRQQKQQPQHPQTASTTQSNQSDQKKNATGNHTPTGSQIPASASPPASPNANTQTRDTNTPPPPAKRPHHPNPNPHKHTTAQTTETQHPDQTRAPRRHHIKSPTETPQRKVGPHGHGPHPTGSETRATPHTNKYKIKQK